MLLARLAQLFLLGEAALRPCHQRPDREDAISVARCKLVRGIVNRELKARVPERAAVLQFETGGLRGATLREVPQHDPAASVAGRRAAEPGGTITASHSGQR